MYDEDLVEYFVIELLAAGRSAAEVAARIGVSTRHVRHRLTDESFREQVARRRAERWSELSERLRGLH